MSEAYTQIDNFLNQSFLGVTIREDIIIALILLCFLSFCLIIFTLIRRERAKTMDDEYKDGSNHEICTQCGLCIPCGDCKKFGCGEEKKNENIKKS